MLFCCGASLHAASSAENSAFNQAVKIFHNRIWDQAVNSFTAFTTNFPASSRIPEVILYQGEALVSSSRFDEGIQLLSTNQSRAGEWGDGYLYWIAQAHLGKTNYGAAAQTFDQLVQGFPTSRYRLEACIGAAAAQAQIGDWPRVIDGLAKPEGVFQVMSRTATNDLIARGYLLLGEAELAHKNFDGANAAVESLGRLPLKSEFAWRRLYLQCRSQLVAGDSEIALSNMTNLLTAASAAGNGQFQAESSLLRAKALEQLKRPDEAVEIYQNLATNATTPMEQQRIAFLKIAEISRAQNKVSEAVQILDKYWNQHPQSRAADLVLLTLGELQLKQAVSGVDVAANLDQSLGRYESLLMRFTNSPYVGKALLGKGWCLWNRGQIAESEKAFREAVEKLPLSEDQAVARFKWADAQFKVGNFDGALANYDSLTTTYDSVPSVKEHLLEQALYQTVRAAIAANNLPAATNAMQKVLKWYPNGFAGDRSLFLVADGYVQRDEPSQARQWLIDYEKRFPTNALLSQVRLAIARTYEKEGNWQAAITNYDAWIQTFTNSAELPKAQFYRALDLAKAGQETNALAGFTDFVSQFPTNELTARAKWWIGDYYFRNGDRPSYFQKAEESYPFTKNFAGSELYFPAQMMAGRAAMARTDYKGAIRYFSGLLNDPACPTDLKIKAAFAAADAYMSRTESGATNRPVDLKEAVSLFKLVSNSHTNAQSIQAWGRLGDCYRELGVFEDATEAYRKVVASSLATIGEQRQAKIGLGLIAVKKAESRSGVEQKALLNDALTHYVDAFTFERELRPGEPNDSFWLQQAGLESAKAAEALGQWPQAINLYTQLRDVKDLPSSLRSILDKKIDRARKEIGAAKNN
jgi:tetratricopeptide (TPR) repeat protein